MGFRVLVADNLAGESIHVAMDVVRRSWLLWLLMVRDGAAAQVTSRRVLLQSFAAAVAMQPLASLALVDCIQDCTSNCNRVAPRSGGYCRTSAPPRSDLPVG